MSGFDATHVVASFTIGSTVFPGVAISDVQVRLTAPSVLAGEAERSYQIDPACLAPPAPAPRPTTPVGACPAADKKLQVPVTEATLPLAARPLRASNRPADLRRMRVTSSDDSIVASDPPSEPRPLLEKHGALEG